ncbi:MAG: FliM/FliN family flagellar motor switch protein [Pirellulaceae bacterium]
MADEEQATDANEQDAASATVDESQAAEGQTGTESDGVEIQEAEFPSLQPDANPKPGPDLNRFHDVQVSISAELGRTKLSINKLLQLGAGSVVELNRSINSPVELVAQGVPLASGEVVVVNDCFAIRIREIYPGQVSEVQDKN